MFELPPPTGPVINRVKPHDKQISDPNLGRLLWCDIRDCWTGVLPRTQAPVVFYPKPEKPGNLPDIWAKWFPMMDRDPEWLREQVEAELKKLAGYGWPVFPFVPTLSLVAFEVDQITLYLRLPELEPHVLEIDINPEMKVNRIEVAG